MARIHLPNGCSMTEPIVNPPNWKTGGKSLIKKDWRVQYYYFDPNFGEEYPHGKLITKKRNINRFKDVMTRREVVKIVISDQIDANKRGYNPITKSWMSLLDEPEYGDIHPDLDFIDAFKAVHKTLRASDKHKDEIRFCLNRIKKASDQLRFKVPIKDFTRRYIKRIFDFLELTPSVHNKYRQYLSKLFDELIELEVVEVNPCHFIKKRKEMIRVRETLTKEHYDLVMDYLKKDYPDFYRYSQIFVYSASRSSELMRLKVSDVDLDNQEYKVLIKKGKQYVEKIKVILPNAIPFWREQLKMSKSKNDYLFSHSLVPGSEFYAPSNITQSWKRVVKHANFKPDGTPKKGPDRKPLIRLADKNGNPLKINADFYALKHTFLDSLPEKEAQQMAAHTSSKTTRIYRVNQEKRNREALKSLNVEI